MLYDTISRQRSCAVLEDAKRRLGVVCLTIGREPPAQSNFTGIIRTRSLTLQAPYECEAQVVHAGVKRATIQDSDDLRRARSLWLEV